jgi:transposase-like protein
MERNGHKRRVYTQEFKAEAAALAEKREKPVSRRLRGQRKHVAAAAGGGCERGLPPFP